MSIKKGILFLAFGGIPAFAASSSMKLLLGSGGFYQNDRTLTFLASQIDSFLGDTDNVLVVPYANVQLEKPMQRIEKNHLLGKRSYQGIHTVNDPVEAVRNAEAILVFGGNTFRLLNALYQKNLIQEIRDRVKRGIPYVGISAGSNVACPTIKTTNDMPIVFPPTFDALGLIPFQINPHYTQGAFFSLTQKGYQKYAGETRDDRIREFHEMNDTDVIGIPEVSFLKVDRDSVTFFSLDPGNARLFKKGQKPRDFSAPANLSSVLKPRGS